MERTRPTGKMRLFALAIVVLLIGAIVVILTWTEIPARAGGGPGKYSLVKYFPLAEGMTWTYLQTYTADGHKEYEVECVGGTETVDGEVTDKLWEFDSGELEYGVIYAYDCMAWTRDGLKLYKGVNSDGSYYTYDPPVIYLPRSIRLGETYTTNPSTRTDYNASGGVIGSTPFSMTLTLETEEDIQVHAGNFADCLRLSGTEIDEGVESDLTLWLADGIGEVRRVFAGEEERELLSFTKKNTTYHPTD